MEADTPGTSLRRWVLFLIGEISRLYAVFTETIGLSAHLDSEKVLERFNPHVMDMRMEIEKEPAEDSPRQAQ